MLSSTVPKGLSAIVQVTSRHSSTWFTAHGMATMSTGKATRATCMDQGTENSGLRAAIEFVCASTHLASSEQL